jgi:Sulfotransferase family
MRHAGTGLHAARLRALVVVPWRASAQPRRSVVLQRRHHARAMSQPFFIVGNDRSGTTMLRLILDSGPDVAIPPESMFLTDFGEAFERGEPRDAEAAARFMDEVWGHPKVRLWDLPGQPATRAAGPRPA